MPRGIYIHPVGEKSSHWKGGLYNSHGYRCLRKNHHRSTATGYVLEHILIAENALGKPLPIKAKTHHFPSKEQCENIVICEDQNYHMFLHKRYRALKVCGHTNWLKCPLCKQYDSPENLSGDRHKSCNAVYGKNRYRLKHGLPVS